MFCFLAHNDKSFEFDHDVNYHRERVDLVEIGGKKNLEFCLNTRFVYSSTKTSLLCSLWSMCLVMQDVDGRVQLPFFRVLESRVGMRQKRCRSEGRERKEEFVESGRGGKEAKV